MIKVFDSELKVMEVLWREGEMTAGQLTRVLKESTGWNPNTTYTVIGKLVDKGAIERVGVNFTCRPLISRRQVQQEEARSLVGKLFDGRADVFLSAFLGGGSVSAEEIAHLKQIVASLEGDKP